MLAILYSLVSLAAAVLGSLLLLRAWLWALVISPRNSLVSFIWRFTDWFVAPVSSLIRPRGNWDWPSLVCALLVALVQVLLTRQASGFPATAVSFAIAPFALVVRWAIEVLTWGMIFYCVLSFVGRGTSPYMHLLAMLLDPLLRPLRRFVPTIGRLDITPVVFFLVLCLLQRFVLPLSLGLPPS